MCTCKDLYCTARAQVAGSQVVGLDGHLDAALEVGQQLLVALCSLCVTWAAGARREVLRGSTVTSGVVSIVADARGADQSARHC